MSKMSVMNLRSPHFNAGGDPGYFNVSDEIELESLLERWGTPQVVLDWYRPESHKVRDCRGIDHE